jgi:hypothetical protein
VADAVVVEPVSPYEFPVTGKNTGNFRNFGPLQADDRRN